MAKKSKTQRAKASAARQARKELREQEEAIAEAKQAEAAAEPEEPKKKFFKKSDKGESSDGKQVQAASKTASKNIEKKPKKRRFQFLRDVKAELKRVTWPTKQDVLRWSVVVVVALVFFGAYVAILDNGIITPVLVAISGLGA